MSEFVLYRWDSESHGPKYFVVEVETWQTFKFDGNTRTELARGTEDEMNRLEKLLKEDDDE